MIHTNIKRVEDRASVAIYVGLPEADEHIAREEAHQVRRVKHQGKANNMLVKIFGDLEIFAAECDVVNAGCLGFNCHDIFFNGERRFLQAGNVPGHTFF